MSTTLAARTGYEERREEIETYFDRTAADAWAKLTSDAPVSGIRATVRAGREQMRATLLSYLPEDLRGRTILDAGCGTGMMARDLAARGAHVVAMDLSPTLIELARERQEPISGEGRIDYVVGDMQAAPGGPFHHTVAMDSLIHYRTEDLVAGLTALAGQTRTSVLFTFAPRTPLLAVMHAAGQFFPKSDRAPAIEPVSETRLHKAIMDEPALSSWAPGRTLRVKSGFYTSQALELTKTEGRRG